MGLMDQTATIRENFGRLPINLIVKYNDGYVNAPEGRNAPGYPKGWLDAVGYAKTKIKNK